MGESTLSTVPAPPPEPTATPQAPPKSGFTTSEFALKIVAFALTTLLGTGWLPTNGTAAQIVAMVSTMLGSFIYTWSRTSIKNANSDGAA